MSECHRQSTREAFVPLHHPPGHAQVDFGEATVEVGGRREKVAFCLIQVLRLLEDFPERQVTAAVQDAVKRRLIGFDAVKHLLLARIERRPVHLDLTRYPHLPQPFAAATRSADYATLLAAGHG